MIRLLVAGCAIGNNRAGTTIAGRSHFQRTKDALVHEIPITAAADILDDEAEEIETGVAIFPGFARLKFERMLANRANELFLREMPGEFEAVQAGIAFD